MNTRKHVLSALALLAAPLAAQATPNHLLVAPQCLVQSATFTPQILAERGSLLLIKADDRQIKFLNTIKHEQTKPCGGFFDVTAEAQHKNPGEFLAAFTATPAKLSRAPAKYAIRYEKQANELIAQLNPQLMWDTLTTFSSNQDRYANSDNGVAAAKWIGAQIEASALLAKRDDVKVSYIATDNYKQPSVVVKVGDSTSSGIVVGAHLDTEDSDSGKMPGADDDGSGSMTVMESARTVITSGMKFNKPIYYIWYAAEEEGMVGSRGVVAQFKKKNIPIDGVMHFDMTGFAYKNQPDIWVFDDYTDKALSAFLVKIIQTYTKRPIQHSMCGYACSDHTSWNMAGYKAVLPAEARYQDTNKAMHTSRDTIDKLSLTHMTDYAKIATAFAVEMAEPTA